MATSSDGDDLVAVCVIRDMSSSRGSQKRHDLRIHGTKKVRELFEEVGNAFGYDPESFQLCLQKRSDNVLVNLDQHLDISLENIGFGLSLDNRNNVHIEDKNGKPPRQLDKGNGQSSTVLALNLHSSSSLPMITAGPSSYPSYSRQSSVPGFVGLVNQAMTCYLNSLLQTLYMTPEFRNALYQWRFDGSSDEAVKSIPYQLQKLFLLLQTSKKTAVETTELTRSFGWDSSEAWQQHDIQELCRVMFDALEHKFKATEHADLISRLYEGKMTDYVKCLECGLEKAREDTFLDVPLPVRPFGSLVAFSSIEESLKAFVQPETLDGNNQYYCDRCAKKCDAHKGLKFSKFPYLLTLHLKRFDFDYSTLQRIKLNDRVTFPELLDLNSFLRDSKDTAAADTDDCLSECTDLDDDASHRTHSSKLSDIESQVGEDDEGIDVTTSSSDPERIKRRALESGPYVYELFSIMIHSGSASGGHYYAYIKDFRTGVWNCFNDQTVTRVTPEDIEKSYGGSSTRSYYSSAYSSSTNAYMLIYRQIDRTRNAEPIAVEQFPEHIKALVRELAERDEAERTAKDRERSHFKIKLFRFHPQKGRIEQRWYIAKDTTLKEALPLAYDKLNLANVIPIERCRLVAYNEFYDSLESSLEGKENETVYNLVTSFGSVKYDLLLETDVDGRGFASYTSAGCTIKLFHVNTDGTVSGPVNTHFSLATTVSELRESVAKLYSVNKDMVRLLWEPSTHTYSVLSDSEKTLKQEGFARSNKVYTETSGESVEKLRLAVDDFTNRTSMVVTVPPITQEMLDRDSIPTLAEYQAAASIATYNFSRDSVPGPASQEYYSQTQEALSLNRWGMKEGEGTSDEEIGNVSIGSTSPQPASPLNTDDCDLIDVDQDLSSDRRFEAGDHSASEDSSLTDSDRTLMGDPPEECVPRAPSPQLPSPDDHQLRIDQVDSCRIDNSYVLQPLVPRFFRVVEVTKENDDKVYKLSVDRRMHLGELKRHIEPYVNVPCDFFRVFKVQSSSGVDRECVNLNETIETIGDEPWLTVRLGRALKPGEIRGKVFHLQPQETEPVSANFLFEWILAPGTSVRQVRQELWKESQKHGIEVPLERFCVRKKSWRSPGKIFADHETVGDENIPLYANWELFIQILPEDREARAVPEGCREDNVVTLFLRRWRPSEFTLEPFREVTFGSYEVSAIKSKLGDLYNVPVDSVQIAKPSGVFPCDMSILRVDPDLDWDRNLRSVEDQPYSILEDGGVLFWRDSRETLKTLTEDERKAINIRENARLQRNNTYTASPSSRKEKALKIYFDPIVPSSTDVDVD